MRLPRPDPDCWFDDPVPGDRRSWAVPPSHGTYQGLDLEQLDPGDEHQLMLLLEALHFGGGRGVPGLDEELTNPELHVLAHVVVANQLLGDDPPETWQTVQRLAGLGYGWHNVMHLIMGPVVEAVFGVLSQEQSFDRADYLRLLTELPGD
jgi:Domain of unknown function (DUF1841)